MAAQRLRNSGWPGGYVDIVYDDVTLDITQIIYANSAAKARIVEVYRMPQDNIVMTVPIPSGTPETTVAAPNNLNLVADAEGSLSLDRFRLQTHSV